MTESEMFHGREVICVENWMTEIRKWRAKSFPGRLEKQNMKVQKYLGMFFNSELFCVLKHQVLRDRQLGDEQKR